MPLGILIPLDEREPLVLMRFDKLEDYQRAVGGYIEAIDVGRDGMTLFAHDEAKLVGTPINMRATLLWWLNLPPARGVDWINGPAVLVGPTDQEGRTQDVPETVRKLLFPVGTRFAVEVSVTGSSRWHREDVSFDDLFTAAEWGLQLTMRRREIEDLRVVAVQT
ncbi:DUF3846 domain-containing protein [Nocardioides cheoyonin]|uniref:DUF3846 domain-containing protein n=1 Tax=Nocardioides cheoyonin TaxID=3156615 RepID=UPI0032B592AE